MATNADDLPPPPPKKTAMPQPVAAVDDDLPPPPPKKHRNQPFVPQWGDDQQSSEWDVGKYGPKPSYWDPVISMPIYLAGTAFGAGKAVVGGISGIATGAYDLVHGAATVMGNLIDPATGEPDPEYQRLKDEWLGTKPIVEGTLALKNAISQWYSLSPDERAKLLRESREQYNKEHGTFEQAFERAKAVGGLYSGPIAGAAGRVVTGAKTSAKIEEAKAKMGRLVGVGKEQTRKDQVLLAERRAKTLKEGKSAAQEAQEVKEGMHQTAHDRVKAIHGKEFPIAENELTPTAEQLPSRIKTVVTHAAEQTERAVQEAGEQMKNWQNALNTKQQADPNGFWKSAQGRQFRDETNIRLLKMKPRRGIPAPKNAPSPDEIKIAERSFERIRGKLAPDGTRLPVSARVLHDEIKRIGSQIAHYIENKPGSPMVGYYQRYQEDLIKALSAYAGETYPAEAYKLEMYNQRAVLDELGLTRTPGVNPKDPPRFVMRGSANPESFITNPEKFQALRLTVGQEAADNLAMQYVANNLQGKNSQQVLEFVKKLRFLDEASPFVHEMTMEYATALATEEGNAASLEKIAMARNAEANALKARIAELGTNRDGALDALKTAFEGKSGPALVSEYNKVRSDLLRFGALTPKQVEFLDKTIEEASKLQTTSERNKMITRTLLRMSGYSAGVYEFGKFVNWMKQ